MPETLTLRRQVLARAGATEAVAAELLRYNSNHFHVPDVDLLQVEPQPEPFVASWRRYAREIESAGTIAPLAAHLVQLNFPIRSGMSGNAEYLAATRRGDLSPNIIGDPGLRWIAPQRVQILLEPSIAGTIPVILAQEREDFVSLVRALARKNEPVAIPLSMGACMIAGYRNWSRRQATLPSAAGGRDGGDRFILISAGNYSGIKASQTGVAPEIWRDLSLRIRIEHECLHYATRRLFGSMTNTLLDELLADSFAVFRSTGRMDGKWLLLFMGLEAYPLYRSGGRMENYRGQPVLSDDAMRVLQTLAVLAIAQLERIFSAFAPQLTTAFRFRVLLAALAIHSLEELAHPEASDKVLALAAGHLHSQSATRQEVSL